MKCGLELHIYLATASKMYCRCGADFLRAAAPNTNVCPVCTAQPGAKPMAPNAEAVRKALWVARLTGSEVPVGTSVPTLRKHYFYPDLPNNYQRTMEPIAAGGRFEGVRITEMHIEEDPGAYELKKGLVDYNRCGVPLLEVVTEPDITTVDGAKRFLEAFRTGLLYLGLVRPDAVFKVDTNVSCGSERVEVKNLNSVANVVSALEYEVRRQTAIVEKGGTVRRETRHFEEKFGETVALRTKETEEDYRFFPDPDLPPLDITEALLRDAEGGIPEDPFRLRDRLVASFAADPAVVEAMLVDRPLVEAFQEVARTTDGRFALEFFARDLRGELHYRSRTFAGTPLSARGLAELVAPITDGRLTRRVAVRILRDWIDGKELAPLHSAELASAVGGADVTRAAAEAVSENPRAVADIAKGKGEAMNFLVGAVLKKLKGRARPDDARRAVEQALHGKL
ncbi:MAG: Asp-tRNA(Asn)/Glu-tRNA(Gln) amidotransferase subunit GatB [Methanobacteriota archaeon]